MGRIEERVERTGRKTQVDPKLERAGEEGERKIASVERRFWGPTGATPVEQGAQAAKYLNLLGATGFEGKGAAAPAMTSERKVELLGSTTKLGAIAAPGLPPPPAADGKLIVVNKGYGGGDQSVMLLDLATGKIGKTIKLPPGPHEIALSPDKSTAVIPNFAGEGVTVFDVAKQKPRLVSMPEYSSPHGAVWLDNKRAAVTANGPEGGSLVVLDVARGRVERAIPVDQAMPHLLRSSPDGKTLYATNLGSGSLSIVDAKSGKVTNVPTGSGAEGVDVSPDGKQVWVGNQGASTISIIDAKTKKVVKTLDSPGGPIRVNFAPDGKTVWIAHRGGNDVTVLDAKTHRRLAKMPMDLPGSVPMEILFHPTLPLAYVCNSHSDLMTVMDTEKRKVVGYYKIGARPDPLAWVPAH